MLIATDVGIAVKESLCMEESLHLAISIDRD
jgi:hypothetical protein